MEGRDRAVTSKIQGCDLHTRYQQIAMLDMETGEEVERRLEHETGEARVFYSALQGRVRVGIEATGHTHWFEAMLAELGHGLWMGDAAKIRASVIRKQKTDARDAAHLLDLLRQDRFPQIWRPSPAERDLRQLVWHRQKLVWMRAAVKNQLHALAMGEGVCRKKKLFTAQGRKELEGLALGPWASYRRQELLRMFDELAAATTQLDAAVEQAAKHQPLAVRLMTHPGVAAKPLDIWQTSSSTHWQYPPKRSLAADYCMGPHPAQEISRSIFWDGLPIWE
jgi:transposase